MNDFIEDHVWEILVDAGRRIKNMPSFIETMALVSGLAAAIIAIITRRLGQMPA